MKNTENTTQEQSVQDEYLGQLRLTDSILKEFRKSAVWGKLLNIINLVFILNLVWEFTSFFIRNFVDNPAPFFLFSENYFSLNVNALIQILGIFLKIMILREGFSAWTMLRRPDINDDDLLDGMEGLGKMLRWMALYAAFNVITKVIFLIFPLRFPY